MNDLGFSSTLELLLRFSCGAMAMALATAITVMVTVTVTLGLLPASGAIAATSRPDPSDSPAMARWVASQSDWGVLRYLCRMSFLSPEILQITASGRKNDLFILYEFLMIETIINL